LPSSEPLVAMTDDALATCPPHYEGRQVDNSAWDGGAAMSRCVNSDTPASCFGSICAGRKSGDPSLAASWALPHHKTAGGPPNAGGVRNAMARLPQTQGLTNAGAARSHLEKHMSAIQNASSLAFDSLEIRTADVATWEVRHSGAPGQSFTVRGYAAVYGQRSHDLGGFTEQIAMGAFDDVLATGPDVHFVWDHDTRYVGARTRNGTLELRSDNTGLFMEAKVGPYSWAKDLMTALQRGDIDQGSFKFSVADGGDSWDVEDDGTVLRTLNAIDGLYDVTVTAQGAYPQTSLAATRSLAAVRAVNTGGVVLWTQTTPTISATTANIPASLLVTHGEGERSSLQHQQGGTTPDPSVQPDDGPEPAVDPEIRALINRAAVARDDIAALIERAGKLHA